MNDIDKALLIKDLCVRLPYGVKALICIEDEASNTFASFPDTITSIDVANDVINDEYSIDYVKPYLFPLSSITEEQRDERYETLGFDVDDDEPLEDEPYFAYLDWLNIHHFDYRELINRGLAIDATNLNIYES